MIRTIGRFLFLSAVISLLAACGSLDQGENAFIEVSDVGPNEAVTLYAGQNIPVGTVIVSDGDVIFSVDAPWRLVETHVAVSSVAPPTGEWTSEGWVNQSNNPVPGLFPYSTTHTPPVLTFTYEGVVAEGTSYIAAHAVVEQVVESAGYFADEVVDSAQGVLKSGNAVAVVRSIPEAVLVQDYPASTVPGSLGFFSLGFPSAAVPVPFVEVAFGCPVVNGEGNDLKVWEVTFGSYPSETARVEAWDAINEVWFTLGTADNSDQGPQGTPEASTLSEFDLGELTQTTRIRIVDTTDPTPHNTVADAFDLDGVQALQACMQQETAWAAGTRFVERGNWATYFTYTTPAP